MAKCNGKSKHLQGDDILPSTYMLQIVEGNARHAEYNRQITKTVDQGYTTIEGQAGQNVRQSVARKLTIWDIHETLIQVRY